MCFRRAVCKMKTNVMDVLQSMCLAVETVALPFSNSNWNCSASSPSKWDHVNYKTAGQNFWTKVEFYWSETECPDSAVYCSFLCVFPFTIKSRSVFSCHFNLKDFSTEHAYSNMVDNVQTVFTYIHLFFSWCNLSVLQLSAWLLS